MTFIRSIGADQLGDNTQAHAAYSPLRGCPPVPTAPKRRRTTWATGWAPLVVIWRLYGFSNSPLVRPLDFSNKPHHAGLRATLPVHRISTNSPRSGRPDKPLDLGPPESPRHGRGDNWPKNLSSGRAPRRRRSVAWQSSRRGVARDLELKTVARGYD